MKPTSDNSSIRKRPLSDHRQLSSAVPYDAGLARGTQPHDVAGPSMAHQADGQGHGSAIEPRPRTPKNVTRHPLKEDESGAQMETRSLAGSTASTGTGRLKKPRSKRAPERPKTRFDVNTDADNNKDSDNARHDVFAVVPSPPKGRKTAGKATSAIKKGPARKNARKSQRGSGQSAKGKTQKPGMDAKYQQASTVIKQRPSAVPTTRARAAKVKTEVEAVASPVKANGDATAIKRTTRASEAGNVQEETYEQFESEVIAFPGAQPDAVSHGDVAGSSQQNAIELASASESELEKEGPIPAPRANESNIRRNQIEGSGSMPHTPYRSSPPDVLGPINGQHYRPVLHEASAQAFSQQQRSNSDTGGSSSVGRDLPSIPPRPDKRSGDISSNTKVQPAVPGLDSQAITGIEVEGIVQRAAQSAQEEAPRTDPFAFPDGQPDIMATPRKVTKLMQTLGREVKEKDLSKSSRPSRKPGNRMAYKFLWEHQNATKELAEEKRMLVEEQREAIEELEDAERTLVEEQSNLDLVGGMASSSSCTSASDFAESVDSQESITSQEARESWRASLNAHQSTLFDALVGISHRLVRHLVDQEIAMGDIVSDFHRRGASLVEAMKQDQENEVKDYVSAVRQAWRTMESVAKPAADSVDAAIKDVKASKAQHRGHSLRQESGLGNRLDALMQMYG
ncbi:hypothetical protein M8818_001725 [Zalaria obscura]|uniref:Uncharacterized protein n=1 Tax=Zalaria obscura TaxID=2024903 RepID=A0ACC3SME5_9PEZI